MSKKRDKSQPVTLSLGAVLNQLAPEVRAQMAEAWGAMPQARTWTRPDYRARAKQKREARLARQQDPVWQAQQRAERLARRLTKMTPRQREYYERGRAIQWGKETRAAKRAERQQAAIPAPVERPDAERIRADQIAAARKMMDDERDE